MPGGYCSIEDEMEGFQFLHLLVESRLIRKLQAPPLSLQDLQYLFCHLDYLLDYPFLDQCHLLIFKYLSE